MLGLYLSFPFCLHKCSFCNFASGVGNQSAIDHYLHLLQQEIANARTFAAAHNLDLPTTADTLYFGGGTPSLLTPTQLEAIFSTLQQHFTLAPNSEITLEAAPDQIPDATLASAQSHGINRISLGVQSFIDREAQAVGRRHTRQSCLEEIRRLRSAGIEDIGIDLIAGLPYQTLDSFRESLYIAAEAGVTHLSVYLFEVDEDSNLGREVLNNGLRLHAPQVPNEDLAADMYTLACEWLPANGFPQYEISNFSTPGHQSRHNKKYWTRAPYLGCGLDAHSMLYTHPDHNLVISTGASSPNSVISTEGATRRSGEIPVFFAGSKSSPSNSAVAFPALRFANPSDLPAYTGHPTDLTPITAEAAAEETLFLGLRLLEGLPIHLLHPTTLRLLTSEHLLETTQTHARLTHRGRLLSNEVFSRLLEPTPDLTPSVPQSTFR